MVDLKGLRLSTEPATPVIALADAKSYLRVDSTADDVLIALFVDAATKQLENHTHRAFINQSWTLTMDSFSSYSGNALDALGDGVHDLPISYLYRDDVVFLARMPIQSITSVKTTDTSDAQTLFTSTNYDFSVETGKLFLKEGSVWPTSLRSNEAIEIIYVAGYGAAATDVPAPLRQAIYYQLGRMYEARGHCELDDNVRCQVEGYVLNDYLGFS